ncbi:MULTISPECIES: hypothetical protein [Klebsiella pneumoniae complex]|uniref:hypothetical protein n=1 Tax=Klebsiella pneumoniae complex TaxID=3390273 RepID=UPI00115C649C|nr:MULTISPECIES: hypothetical protein [Klebsiella]HBQ3451108.1 hypothetical protein [Klebsiella variicola subsp. variicola]HDH1524435.1 hypothetical protein [Klebsiella quasipneumoniae subsp. similipneumoniae]HDK6690981.1 hypothetical protein [Klebsiella quasipneumoniae]HDU5967040.1 hypothetical protein [Klebsiella pneumoniae subsp. ozaenae]EKJ5235535.1 hypothetical protein [Klebsiella pneumoniae]
MAEEAGRLTFFDVTKAGFYNLKDEVQKSADIVNILDSLTNWVCSLSFEETLPLVDDSRLRKKVYCRGVHKDEKTGDYFFVLWKSELDGNGNLLGVAPDSKVNSSSNDVMMLSDDMTDGVKYIWGKPCYYWYIPELNKFAAIRFPHSNSDTYLFGRYIRDYANFRMPYPGRKISEICRTNPGGKDIKFSVVTFESDDGHSRVRFLFEAQQYMKKAGRVNIKKIRDSITHIVIRDTIGAKVPDKRAWWVKAFDKFPVLRDEVPKTHKERQIELIIEERPTEKQIDELFDFYEEDYAFGSSWNNIGFKQDGKNGQTKWLDEYVMRDYLNATYTVNDNAHISAEKLAELINAKRDELVSGLDGNQMDKILVMPSVSNDGVALGG